MLKAIEEIQKRISVYEKNMQNRFKVSANLRPESKILNFNQKKVYEYAKIIEELRKAIKILRNHI